MPNNQFYNGCIFAEQFIRSPEIMIQIEVSHAIKSSIDECTLLVSYPSVLEFQKIKFEKSSLMNWIFSLFWTAFLLPVYTAILYRAWAGQGQGFPCVEILTGKTLFSLQGTPLLIAGILYSLQENPRENY